MNELRPLSPEVTAALMKAIRYKELRKGQVWLKEGEVCNKITFVVKGLMKLYFEEGSRDVILCFGRRNDWVIAAQSFYDQTMSKYSIRAVEKCIVVYLPRSDFVNLLEKFPELSLHFSAIAQLQASALEYHTGLLLLPAKCRFVKFIESGLSEGISDKLIAGYLGVSQNSICNWRKEA